ncbi:hypothetical protein [Chryseobacterium oncorhynchi]|uniref:Uncharacterized protein n=1 Tax=Chryseobacterium oncorhynchi TaxID=741074 RepID=A0A316X8H2_9FLAO|nr:hypothetical protein [Chryseobacterium oncorhynchi]PWN67618.1 hypothetical protein C1638_003235 [Chryseobacterium oncorhynchi]
MKRRTGKSWYLLSRESPNKNWQEELNQILKILDYKPETNLIQNGLDYFRNCHTTRPISYPGDSIYYNIFMNGMRKGLNQQDAFNFAKDIIDREMKILDMTLSSGMVYIFNWQEEPSLSFLKYSKFFKTYLNQQ